MEIIKKVNLGKRLETTTRNDSDSLTLLMTTSVYSAEVLKLFEDNINIKSRDDRAVLSCASRSNNIEIIRALLNCGADLNARNDKRF